MADKPIVALPKFLEQAAALPKEIKAKIFKILKLLSGDTKHPGLQTKKLLKTKVTVFECRVDRSIRLIYDVFKGSLRCWYVGPHDEAINFGNRLTKEDIQNLDDIEISVSDHPLSLIAEYVNRGELPPTSDFVGLEESEVESLFLG